MGIRAVVPPANGTGPWRVCTEKCVSFLSEKDGTFPVLKSTKNDLFSSNCWYYGYNFGHSGIVSKCKWEFTLKCKCSTQSAFYNPAWKMLPYRKGMHLDARTRIPNHTRLYLEPRLLWLGEIIDTQFMSKMMGADDQVRLVRYNPAKLLSQDIICFDAALIPLMIIHIVPYSLSYITAGCSDHRHSLSHPANARAYFLKKNIKVKHPPCISIAGWIPCKSTSADFDVESKNRTSPRVNEEQQWHAT